MSYGHYLSGNVIAAIAAPRPHHRVMVEGGCGCTGGSTRYSAHRRRYPVRGGANPPMVNLADSSSEDESDTEVESIVDVASSSNNEDESEEEEETSEGESVEEVGGARAAPKRARTDSVEVEDVEEEEEAGGASSHVSPKRVHEEALEFAEKFIVPTEKGQKEYVAVGQAKVDALARQIKAKNPSMSMNVAMIIANAELQSERAKREGTFDMPSDAQFEAARARLRAKQEMRDLADEL